jgi:hypothetical protein
MLVVEKNNFDPSGYQRVVDMGFNLFIKVLSKNCKVF